MLPNILWCMGQPLPTELAQNVDTANVENTQSGFIEFCGADLSGIQSCSTATSLE